MSDRRLAAGPLGPGHVHGFMAISRWKLLRKTHQCGRPRGDDADDAALPRVGPAALPARMRAAAANLLSAAWCTASACNLASQRDEEAPQSLWCVELAIAESQCDRRKPYRRKPVIAESLSTSAALSSAIDISCCRQGTGCRRAAAAPLVSLIAALPPAVAGVRQLCSLGFSHSPRASLLLPCLPCLFLQRAAQTCGCMWRRCRRAAQRWPSCWQLGCPATGATPAARRPSCMPPSMATWLPCTSCSRRGQTPAQRTRVQQARRRWEGRGAGQGAGTAPRACFPVGQSSHPPGRRVLPLPLCSPHPQAAQAATRRCSTQPSTLAAPAWGARCWAPAPLRVAVACGMTPLHLAACFGHTGFAELLLSAGADVDAGGLLCVFRVEAAQQRGAACPGSVPLPPQPPASLPHPLCLSTAHCAAGHLAPPS